MKVLWSESAWDDYIYWQNIDKKKVKRINSLIKATQRSPLEGLGNPETLKHGLKGYYSRRIDSQLRLVYTIKDSSIYIVQCRHHY